ncbi:hypothetical protein F5148DRAFT_1166722 [Russula earlei]|uniref:Uncharacterized protein n=1 Tax=Russula earlei TaxID=71964 RepID=A0ACC0UL26_9AGAM|nr:hypothetical protein F5148DRAFT_1166722 [Russula earlei]
MTGNGNRHTASSSLPDLVLGTAHPMSSSSPAAQSDKPKGLEAPSSEKDTAPGSQTAPSEPKQTGTKPATTAEKAGETVVPSQAPTTDYLAVASTPSAPGSTPGPYTDPSSEKAPQPAPATEDPIERQREFRRRRALIIHTRLARFFTWLLLLGFVIVPGTFKPGQGSSSGSLHNISLLPIAYLCTALNAVAVLWLWRQRQNDPSWLFTNLFFAGLINAFSGMITTLVNIYGAQGGQLDAGSKATIAIPSTFTIIYALLSLIFYRKVKRLRDQRPRSVGGELV